MITCFKIAVLGRKRIMPAKGTKKVRSHTRQKSMFKFGDVDIKDPFSKPTRVRTHFRKKPKRRK
jgi:hypothetical protein